MYIFITDISLCPWLSGETLAEAVTHSDISFILNTTIYNEVITVSNSDAYMMAKRVAQEEGLLVGISAGANLYASYQVALKPENRGKTIVTILCDTAERYLSTELFDL
jgi:cysteine synthase A